MLAVGHEGIRLYFQMRSSDDGCYALDRLYGLW